METLAYPLESYEALYSGVCALSGMLSRGPTGVYDGNVGPPLKTPVPPNYNPTVLQTIREGLELRSHHLGALYSHHSISINLISHTP